MFARRTSAVAACSLLLAGKTVQTIALLAYVMEVKKNPGVRRRGRGRGRVEHALVAPVPPAGSRSW